MNLKGRHFLKLLDFTPDEIATFLDRAAELKAQKKAGVPHRHHEGKNIALIFEKTSTRTRCAFEVAARDLGMGVTYLDPSGSQIGKKESIADTARVLGRMFDGIEYRGFGQEIVETLAANAGVPVWNGLTNEYHPTQILADFLTIREHFGSLKGKKLVYMGDARYNMGNSLMVGCAKMGMHFVACAPEKYFPNQELIAQCRQIAQEWSAAMQAGKEGSVRDFVAVGDVQIKVIGGENPILDSEIPVRQILEQLVARTGIPPFMLGLSWSSTERMSAQHADVLEAIRTTGELSKDTEAKLKAALESYTKDFLKTK